MCILRIAYLRVVPRALILVLHKQTDRCSKRDAMLNTRLQVDEVLLVTLLIECKRITRRDRLLDAQVSSDCSGRDVCG